MIARIWHGAVPVAKSDEYLERMRTVALPDYKSTVGNRGAFCLHRVQGNVAHFAVPWGPLASPLLAVDLAVGPPSIVSLATTVPLEPSIKRLVGPRAGSRLGVLPRRNAG